MKTFKANLNSLYSMLDFVRSSIPLQAFSEDEISKIELALEEALVNIIYYAYPDNKGEILLECQPDSNNHSFFVITISDYGIPFNPVEYSGRSKDKETVGGHGINYIKQIMDVTEYQRINNMNVFVLKRKMFI